MHHRYAIYYCPGPQSPWWTRGSQWLGRCALTQRDMQVPAVEHLSEEAFRELTKDPRRYGWHATLKAPFTLAAGLSRSDLIDAVCNLASAHKSFDLPAMEVRRMGHFLALAPAKESAALDAIARACVTSLQPLAAALTDAELARRRKSRLTAQEDALLVQWGYPYVLDAFRFHCSLTGDLKDISDGQRQVLIDAATQWFCDLPAPRFDSLAVVAEPSPGADFVVLEHLELAP